MSESAAPTLKIPEPDRVAEALKALSANGVTATRKDDGTIAVDPADTEKAINILNNSFFHGSIHAAPKIVSSNAVDTPDLQTQPEPEPAKIAEEVVQLDEISHETRGKWITATWKKHLDHIDDKPHERGNKPPMPEARKKIFNKATNDHSKESMRRYDEKRKADIQSREPQVHDLRHMSHGEVYDHTQTNEKIKDGDVLHVKGGVAALLGAWPTMIHGTSKTLHSFKDGTDIHNFDDGVYHQTAKLAAKTHGLKEDCDTLNSKHLDQEPEGEEYRDIEQVEAEIAGVNVTLNKRSIVNRMENQLKKIDEENLDNDPEFDALFQEAEAEDIRALDETSRMLLKNYLAKNDSQQAEIDTATNMDGGRTSRGDLKKYVKREAGRKMAYSKLGGTAKVNAREDYVSPALKTVRSLVEKVLLDEAKGQKLSAVIHSDCGKHSAKIYKDSEWGEHVVKFHINGKHHEPADYHTNDYHDAHGTAKLELSRMTKLNGALKEAHEDDIATICEEHYEQLDEVSKALLMNFGPKAMKSATDLEHKADKLGADGNREASIAMQTKADVRRNYVKKAANKLAPWADDKKLEKYGNRSLGSHVTNYKGLTDQNLRRAGLKEEAEQLEEGVHKVGTYTDRAGETVTLHQHPEDKKHHVLVRKGKVVKSFHDSSENVHAQLTKDNFKGALHEAAIGITRPYTGGTKKNDKSISEKKKLNRTLKKEEVEQLDELGDTYARPARVPSKRMKAPAAERVAKIADRKGMDRKDVQNILFNQGFGRKSDKMIADRRGQRLLTKEEHEELSNAVRLKFIDSMSKKLGK
jgi:hypothetical protein